MEICVKCKWAAHCSTWFEGRYQKCDTTVQNYHFNVLAIFAKHEYKIECLLSDAIPFGKDM